MLLKAIVALSMMNTKNESFIEILNNGQGPYYPSWSLLVEVMLENSIRIWTHANSMFTPGSHHRSTKIKEIRINLCNI